MAVREEIKESIAKGTMNPRILGSFFDEMKIKSYKYDIRMQRELVDLFQTKFNVSDMKSSMAQAVFSEYPMYDRILEYTIDHPFIIAGQRERYKRSSVFHKYMDIATIVENRKFFQYNLLVFAGGKILLNYKLKAFNDKVTIAFKEKELEDVADTTIRVIYLPDSLISYINPDASMFNGTTLDARIFPNWKKFVSIQSYVGFWINKNTGDTFMVPDITFDAENKVFRINDLLPTNLSLFKLAVVGINTLQVIKDITPDTEWVRLGIDKMPLPAENIIIFRYENGFFIPSVGEEYLTGYYPDAFKITNPSGKNLRLFVLYEDNTNNEHITFDNEATYYLERNNVLEQYKNGTVPAALRDFEPVDWKYSIEDFVKKYTYENIDFRDIWDSLEYNLDTINSMLKKWFYLFREYEDATYGFRKGWYHKLSNYDNLSEKERINTFAEFPETPELHCEFAQVQYLFTYMDDMETGNVNSFCFFVDGRFTIPTKIIVYRGIQYVYFPKAIFTRDSVIEVERFDGNYFSYQMNLAESDTLHMGKLMSKSTPANNIFLVSPTTGEYLNKGELKTFIVDPILGEYEVDLQTSVFIVYPESYLRIEKVNYNEDTVMVCCNNITYKFFCMESGNDFLWEREPLINLNQRGYINHVKQGLLHRLRIYTHDGRLMPKREYNVFLHKKYTDMVRFNIPIHYGTNENFLVSYIGYDESLIYHKTDINPDGILDLEGRLNRPFSFVYHDIYLDGFRLTKYDVEQIAPFTISVNKAIKKYDTTGNIEIYEKTLPQEDMHHYEWAEMSQFLADKLYDAENSEYVQQIKDENPPVNVSGSVNNLDFMRDWFYSFVREQLMYRYINGDLRYDWEAYHLLFDLHTGRMLLNADDRVRYIKSVKEVWYMNKDKTIELYKVGDKVVYPVPEQKEMAESTVIVDTSIVMTEEDYMKYGFATDNFNRVYDEDHSKHIHEFIPTNGFQDAVFYEKYFDLSDRDRFPHIDFDGRYNEPFDDGSGDPFEVQAISETNYKMFDVYPYFYMNMPTVPSQDVDEWNKLVMDNWSELYRGCRNLHMLPNIYLAGAKNISNICKDCESLTTLPDIFKTPQVTDFDYAFDGCYLLQGSYLENLSYDSMRFADSTFRNCKMLTRMINTIDYSKLVSMVQMYAHSGITETSVDLDIKAIMAPQMISGIFEGTNVTSVHLFNVAPGMVIEANSLGSQVTELFIDYREDAIEEP